MPTYEGLKRSREVQRGIGIDGHGNPRTPDTGDNITLTGKAFGVLTVVNGEKVFTLLEEDNKENEPQK